eukprot:CAMPEP_0168382346 /NCGR_PEP_ID=MMETSP0228-20121227/13348_1 /TAXON_ID=133427 /ORGANISM="Protoceratium reticulatum, Strain CCCM 535 (=CCMP 1889)" /LENGTH=164 /DNA_ID=CAMNT_0008395479 /DNA_START=139 /DNA_END=631 /DNA_ORIENTATION=-
MASKGQLLNVLVQVTRHQALVSRLAKLDKQPTTEVLQPNGFRTSAEDLCRDPSTALVPHILADQVSDGPRQHRPRGLRSAQATPFGARVLPVPVLPQQRADNAQPGQELPVDQVPGSSTAPAQALGRRPRREATSGPVERRRAAGDVRQRLGRAAARHGTRREG